MSEIEMCIPFMREKAENLSSIIFDTTPNIIAILDKNLDIIKLNLAAQKFFDISNQKAKGLPILMFLEEEKFKKAEDERFAKVEEEKKKAEEYALANPTTETLLKEIRDLLKSDKSTKKK